MRYLIALLFAPLPILAQGFATDDNGSKIGIDLVATNSPITFDSASEFQIFVFFEKVGTGSDDFPRILEHADGGNGANGYTLGTGTNAASKAGLLLYNGSGTSIDFGSDQFSDGDILMLVGTWNNSSTEMLNVSVNRGSLPAGTSAAVANANNAVVMDFRIGGSTDWSTTRDSHTIVYRVLMYSALQSDRNKEVMAKSHGRSFPVANLVAAWATTDFSVNSGGTISGTVESIVGPDLDAVDGTPTAKASVVGHHPLFQGMMY